MRLALANAMIQIPSRTRLQSAFQLAIDRLRNSHATSSHITKFDGADDAEGKRSAPDKFDISRPEPVHDVGPSHQSRSTPVWKIPMLAVVKAAAAPAIKSSKIGKPVNRSAPTAIATPWGYLCQMHMAQGA